MTFLIQISHNFCTAPSLLYRFLVTRCASIVVEGKERERERENRSRRRVDRYCARSRIKFRGFIRTLAMGRIDRIILDQTRIWMGRSGGIWDCLLRLEPTKGTVLSLLNSCLDSSDDSPSPTSLYLL